MLLQAIAFYLFSTVLLISALAVVSARKFGWFATPAAVVAGGSALLSGWAALIHLTGGEKFDDHRWT